MFVRIFDKGEAISIHGEYYCHTLESLHLALRPKNYFEIGTLNGATLVLSQSHSVAVDPQFQLTLDVEAQKPSLKMFETTSDDFFAKHDLKAELGGPVGIAFLDGMHKFDFLLRDFINTEKACDTDSVVLMHDCLPLDAEMTRDLGEPLSKRFPGYWTGDVWKMVPVLRKWRPDITLSCLDAPPTGLTVARGLDPKNTVLADNYEAIVAEWASLYLGDYGMARLVEDARVESAESWRRQHFGPVEAAPPPVSWKRRLWRMLPFTRG